VVKTLKTAAEHAKQAGLPSLLKASEISGQSVQTLNNWLKNKPFVFHAVIEKSSKVYKMNKLNQVLLFILAEIKKENESGHRENCMSQDSDSQCLVNIFHDAMNKFSDIEFNLIDDEDALVEIFGQAGFESIREAEQGVY